MWLLTCHPSTLLASDLLVLQMVVGSVAGDAEVEFLFLSGVGCAGQLRKREANGVGLAVL